MTLYLDTSALTKFMVLESESAALRAAVAEYPRTATSALAEVELMRVAHRLDEDLTEKAREILDSVEVSELTPAILRIASNVLPSTHLRSLDAIHLAAAMALPDLTAVCTYDVRMAQAARDLGLRTIAPV